MRARKVPVLTFIAAVVALGLVAVVAQAQNHGYNSYEGYLSDGMGLKKWYGPGVGYPAESGDYYRRYVPQGQWGKYGYGTGHLNEGYGPYIFPPKHGPSPPGLFDPLPGAYQSAPPPAIKIGRGQIRVSVPSKIPGIAKVTVTMVAFNNADLAIQSKEHPPFDFMFPVQDGVKNVRVRIDYCDSGLSATSYPL